MSLWLCLVENLHHFSLLNMSQSHKKWCYAFLNPFLVLSWLEENLKSFHIFSWIWLRTIYTTNRVDDIIHRFQMFNKTNCQERKLEFVKTFSDFFFEKERRKNICIFRYTRTNFLVRYHLLLSKCSNILYIFDLFLSFSYFTFSFLFFSLKKKVSFLHFFFLILKCFERISRVFRFEWLHILLHQIWFCIFWSLHSMQKLFENL